MLEVIAKTFIAFISTSIDDLAVFVILFAGAGKKRRLPVAAGQLLGMAVILAISAAGAFGAKLLPESITRWIGLIPIGIGIGMIFSHKKDDDEGREAGAAAYTFPGAAMTLIMNGFDNIGVYIPMFTQFSEVETAVSCAVFLLFTVLWGIAAYRISSIRRLNEFLSRNSRYIVPALMIVIGAMVILGI